MSFIITKLKELGQLFKSPLSLRIVLGMFISLSIIEAIVLVPSVERRKDEILEQVEEVSAGKVNWIVMTYPNASGVELLNHLEDLSNDPMLQVILGGAVYRADGSLVGTFGEVPALTFAAAGQSSQLYQQQADGSRYDVAWTTQQADGSEYVLVLRHNSTGTRAALSLYILRFIGIVLMISAFITMVMMVLLSRQLITPILTLRRDLSLAGTAIANDQPAPRFELCRFYRRDELGEVIDTFQEMYKQISEAIGDRKQAEADLRESNEHMRQYLEQVERVTSAATALDNNEFVTTSLDDVAQRSDELGNLARMFQLMAHHIQQRESQLKQQLKELTIEIDQAKRQRDVAQITSSDYFHELQSELEEYKVEEFWNQS